MPTENPNLYAGQIENKKFIADLCSKEGEDSKNCSFDVPMKHFFYVKVKANQNSTDATLKISGKNIKFAYRLLPSYEIE